MVLGLKAITNLDNLNTNSGPLTYTTLDGDGLGSGDFGPALKLAVDMVTCCLTGALVVVGTGGGLGRSPASVPSWPNFGSF